MAIKLEVVEGPQQGREFVFQGHDHFIVGRARCAHFRLSKADRYVSRVHFMLEINPPLCRLVDLGSRNGTRLNGKPVERADLRDGDLIQGGNTLFRVRNSDASTEASAAEAEAAGTQPPGPSLAATQPYRPATAPAPAGAAGPPAGQELPDVDGFEVVRELGRGGMGVVYLARRLSDGADVALKTIQPAVCGLQQEVDRFLREARILSQLRHPGIVQFQQIGQAGPLLYFAMEYVEGIDSLSALKKRERFSIIPSVKVACEALDAIHYAHERGFVHRDVKPSNLLLARKGAGRLCKLADFGLARAYNSSPLSGLTTVGDAGGTLPYMPPEQITDYRRVQPPADQYAMAATLYHLLTGRYIFDFEDLPNQQRLTRILFDPHVPIQTRRGDVPDGLAWVIDRALEKEPAKRFSDAAAFREALLPYARRPP